MIFRSASHEFYPVASWWCLFFSSVIAAQSLFFFVVLFLYVVYDLIYMQVKMNLGVHKRLLNNLPDTTQFLGFPLSGPLARNLSLYLLLSAMHFLQLCPLSEAKQQEIRERKNIYQWQFAPSVLGPQLLQLQRRVPPSLTILST